MITREFKLYLNAGVGVAPVINANQFDQDEDWIFTLLTEEGTVYTPSTGAIIGLKTDGTTILNAGTVNSSGQVVITETEQMTAVPGSNVFELLIDGNSHGTANFVVFVERRPGDIDNPSESDISLFQEAIEAAGNIEQFQADISALQSGLSNTNANLTAETSARASADATLQSNISTEASTRQTQDAVLQAEIDQIIAPTGEAPSAAEVQNARIGVDGTTYDTLGNAIRGQVSDLKNALNVLNDTVGIEKDLLPYLTTAGAIQKADGVPKTTGPSITDYYKYSPDFIPVRLGEKLSYTLRTPTDYIFIAFYSSASESSYVEANSVEGTGAISTGVYVVPADGFIRLTSRNEVAGKKAGLAMGNSLIDKVADNTSDITGIESEITGLETDIGELESEMSLSPTDITNTLTQEGGIKTDGTENNSSSIVSSYHRSDYIEVSKGYAIEYTDVRTTNLGLIALYNSSKVFDSTNSIIGTGASISGLFIMPYDGYVRLSCRNQELSANASFVLLTPIKTETKRLDTRIDGLDARIDDIENDGVPSEWVTYLETKKASIKSALVNIGNTGEAFVFITDCHVPRNNMLTPKIVKLLNNDCPVNYHINGGDFLDINTDSAQSALNDLWKWKDAMCGITEYCIMGNHDLNNFNGENTSNALTVGQFYAVMDRQIENAVNTGGKTYYCIDNESQKIRIIVLDSSTSDKTTMYSWFSTKLTELDSTWTILVMQHYLWGSTTETIHTRGQETINAINAVYSSINAEFIGILAGHTHTDYNSTESVNGYLLIARDTNMVNSGTGTNTLSFDYVTINTSSKTINFTKIGRGSDLSLSY